MMIEQLLVLFLTIIATTFSAYDVVLAILFIELEKFTEIISWNSKMLISIINTMFPSLSTIAPISLALFSIKDKGWYLLLIILFLIILILIGYLYFISYRGKYLIESRRYNRSIIAMGIIYGMILVYSGYYTICISIDIHPLLSSCIFLVSLLGMMKTKIPVFVYFLVSILFYFIFI